MSFSFGFSGDDIEGSSPGPSQPLNPKSPPRPRASAFPIPGKPLLPPQIHSLQSFTSSLPSKVAYSSLSVELSSGATINLPRRELWDVRVQLMAEEDEGKEANEGLGDHDVKTGVYEGGFKSWESSVDLVKVLFDEKTILQNDHARLCAVELGCGTALPSLALFIWLMSQPLEKRAGTFILADYNPTVLSLVTVPNLILAWALNHSDTPPLKEALDPSEGELDLNPDVIQAFTEYLQASGTELHFVSGAWSSAFVDLVAPICRGREDASLPTKMVVLGAETIYSPFALETFAETIFSLLNLEQTAGDIQSVPLSEVLVAAKRHYFGVGGSLDDFVTRAQEQGAVVSLLREETEGVRRGVVRVLLDGQRGS